MGEIVKERTTKLFRAVCVLSILNSRYEPEVRRGLTAHDIARKMGQLENNKFTAEHVNRWINEINEWSKDYGYDKIVLNTKDNDDDCPDDGRIPEYFLSFPVKPELHHDMVKILSSYILFDHGYYEVFKEMEDINNILLILTNLFYALENKLIVRIRRRDTTGNRSFLYKPYMVFFNKKLELYGTPYGLDEIVSYPIDNKVISIEPTENVFQRSPNIINAIKVKQTTERHR